MNEIAFNKPSIIDISSFDATESQQIYFNVTGGDLFTKALVIVTERDTPNIVYARLTLDTQNDYFILPANSLDNNRDYALTLQLGDGSTWSEASASDYFSCFARPTLSITNIQSDGSTVIESRSFTFSGTYSQPYDPIRYYRYCVYAYDGSLFFDSGNIYDSLVSVQVTGFASASDYSVQLEAFSQSGISNTTEKIPFSVLYSSSGLESQMGIMCDHQTGDVSIRVRVGNSRGEYYDLIDGVLYKTEDDPIFVEHKDSTGALTKWLSIPEGKAVMYAVSDAAASDFSVQVWFTRLDGYNKVYDLMKIMCGDNTILIRCKEDVIEALCTFNGKQTIYGVQTSHSSRPANETLRVSIKNQCLNLEYLSGGAIA